MRLEEVIGALRLLDLFRCFEADALRVLAFSVDRRALRPGDVLVRKGETGEGGLLLLSGSAVCDPGDDGAPGGREIGPGTLIGELNLFTACEGPATIVVREPGFALAIRRDLMSRVLDAHPDTALKVRDFLTRRAGRMAAELQALQRRLG